MELELFETNCELHNQLIVFKVNEDCNLWPFVLLVFDQSGSTQVPIFSYVFESYDVKAGDFVVIKTGREKFKEGRNKLGTVSHCFSVGDFLFFQDSNNLRYLVVLSKVNEVKKFICR